MSWFEKLMPSRISTEKRTRSVPQGVWMKCPECDEQLYRKEVERNLNVCPKCAHHMRVFGYMPRHRASALCQPAGAARCALELGRAALAALAACVVLVMPTADRLVGIPADLRAERQLARWLNLNPAAWRHWAGWDAKRAVAVQLHPQPQEPTRGSQMYVS